MRERIIRLLEDTASWLRYMHPLEACELLEAARYLKSESADRLALAAHWAEHD